jgi:molybdenum cofactor biosynthesis protein MoaC
VELYQFDGISSELELVPLAARRALDRAGRKLSLEAWRHLDHAARRELVELGSEREVDVSRVVSVAGQAVPVPAAIEAVEDPPADAAPGILLEQLGPERPVPDNVWALLSPLDRYVLCKVASRGKPERLEAAYREIVGQSAHSSHVGPRGGVRMVSVSQKEPTARRAIAESWVTMSQEAFARLESASSPKGDVLGTARLAGIMGAKRTSDLIPLCHPLSLTHAEVRFESHAGEHRVRVLAEVEVIDRTGVEMEAMVAASTAALTIYDMLKSIDRSMSIGPTRLLEKSGGRSGHFRANESEAGSLGSDASTRTPGGTP